MDNELKTHREERDEDKGGATEVATFFRRQFRWIAGLAVLGAIVGGATSFLHPREWEATSVLQMGQIDEGTVSLIDSPAQAAQRVMVDSFADLVISLAAPSIGGDSEANLVRRTLIAEALPGTNLVRLKVRGYSPEHAENILQVVQNELISVHGKIETAAVERLQRRLDDFNRQIERVQSTAILTRAQAAGGAHEQAGSAAPAHEDMLLGDILTASNQQLLDSLKAQRQQLIRELGPDHTFNTKSLGSIIVSPRPVAPNRIVYAVLGALIGLLVGLFVVVTLRASQRAVAQAGVL